MSDDNPPTVEELVMLATVPKISVVARILYPGWPEGVFIESGELWQPHVNRDQCAEIEAALSPEQFIEYGLSLRLAALEAYQGERTQVYIEHAIVATCPPDVRVRCLVEVLK